MVTLLRNGGIGLGSQSGRGNENGNRRARVTNQETGGKTVIEVTKKEDATT